LMRGALDPLDEFGHLLFLEIVAAKGPDQVPGPQGKQDQDGPVEHHVFHIGQINVPDKVPTPETHGGNNGNANDQHGQQPGPARLTLGLKRSHLLPPLLS